jgi:hypothetical protein
LRPFIKPLSSSPEALLPPSLTFPGADDLRAVSFGAHSAKFSQQNFQRLIRYRLMLAAGHKRKIW